ncbi:hypothetical protein [uncultured Corynebacterium sp.]|nr:hypothetical protein [uncultured Corynebacterium sp.]
MLSTQRQQDVDKHYLEPTLEDSAGTARIQREDGRTVRVQCEDGA